MATSTWNFGSDAEGLKFTVVYDSVTNKFTVTVLTGSMNVNALYWTDGDSTANEGSYAGFTGAKSESSLNMNGTGQTWDGGLKISDAGLGKTPPASYITADPNDAYASSFSIDAGNFNPANFGTIGVRATSTSTEGGSIKWVNEGPDEAPPPTDDHFPAWDAPAISHITLYWRDDSVLVDDAPNASKGGPDGWFTVKFNYNFDDPEFPLTNDLDNDLEALLNFLVGRGDITEAHKANLVGVAVKGGQSGEVWYDLDNDPNDTDTPPGDIPDYPIVSNEVDQAYDWNATTDNWVLAG
jgi:hypothetical protein